MDIITRYAHNFRRTHKLPRLPIDLPDLMTVCRRMGYDLITYDQGQAVIEQRGLTSRMAGGAFVCRAGDIKIIFYDGGPSRQEQIWAITHEIGHIILGHTSPRSTAAEQEADEFAFGVLAPNDYLRRHGKMTPGEIAQATNIPHSQAERLALRMQTDRARKRGLRVMGALCLVLIAACVIMTAGMIAVNTPSPALASVEQPTVEYVYVTPNGHRYHRIDC